MQSSGQHKFKALDTINASMEFSKKFSIYLYYKQYVGHFWYITHSYKMGEMHIKYFQTVAKFTWKYLNIFVKILTKY